MTEEWGYNLILYLFLLAIWFSTSHLLSSNQRVRRISLHLMWGVWTVQSIMLIFWLLNITAWVAYVDALFIFAWGLVTLYLIMSRFARFDILIYTIQLIGLIVMISFYLFLGQASTTIEQLMLSKWIFSHVMIAIAGYAVLSISSICAAFYLITNYLLKRRKWNHLLRRLPSLTELQLLSKRLVRVGLALLLIAIIQGIVLAYPTMKLNVLLDPKTWGSLWVWITYAVCLYPFTDRRWCGRHLAWWNLLSILVVVINYFMINSGSSFHYWI